MADCDVVNSRREIRRRKILENSEARIKKIVGRNANPSSDDKFPMPEVISEDTCLYAKISDANAQRTRVISPDEENVSKKQEKSFVSANGDSLIRGILRNEYKQWDENYSRQNGTYIMSNCYDSEGTEVRNGTTRQGISEAYSFPKKVSDAETRSYGRSRLDSRRNSSCTQIMIESLQLSSFKCSILRPWIFVIIAVFIRIVILSDCSFLVTQNLLLPFMLLEIFVYVWIKLEAQVYPRSPSQSVIPGLLMLCGVPLSIVSPFTELYSTVYLIGQDFAIYLFSFVFFHFLLLKL